MRKGVLLIISALIFILISYLSHEGFIYLYKQKYDYKIDRSWGLLLEGSFFISYIFVSLLYGALIWKNSIWKKILSITFILFLILFIIKCYPANPYRTILFITTVVGSFCIPYSLLIKRKIKNEK
jgi:hypothetical protein